MTDARKEIRRLKEKLTGFSSELSALESLLGGNDAPSILTKVRFITEKLLQAVCLRNDMKWGEGPPTIERMIGPLIARGAVPSDIALFVRTIQTHASPGSHYQRRPLSLTHVNIALEALIKTLEWYFTSEDPHVLPRSEPAHGSTTQRIRLIGAIGVAVLAVLAGTILWLHKVQSAQGLRLREHMVAFINAAHSLGEYSGKSAKERADIMRWSLNQADEILGGGGIGPQSIPGLEAIAQSPGGNAVGTRVVEFDPKTFTANTIHFMEAARGAGRFTIMNDDKRAEEMRWALNNVQDSTGAGTFGSESSAGLRMIATVKAQ